MDNILTSQSSGTFNAWLHCIGTTQIIFNIFATSIVSEGAFAFNLQFYD